MPVTLCVCLANSACVYILCIVYLLFSNICTYIYIVENTFTLYLWTWTIIQHNVVVIKLHITQNTHTHPVILCVINTPVLLVVVNLLKLAFVSTRGGADSVYNEWWNVAVSIFVRVKFLFRYGIHIQRGYLVI